MVPLGNPILYKSTLITATQKGDLNLRTTSTQNVHARSFGEPAQAVNAVLRTSGLPGELPIRRNPLNPKS